MSRTPLSFSNAGDVPIAGATSGGGGGGGGSAGSAPRAGGPGGPARYARVAATYPRPWMFRVLAGALAIYLFALAMAVPVAEFVRLPFLLTLLWLVAWWAATVAAHLKDQLADPRAALTPGYREPHVVVGAVAMLLPLVLVVALQPVLRHATFGGVALALLVMAGTAWAMHVQTATSFVLWIGAVLTLTLAPVRHTMLAVVDGRGADVGPSSLVTASDGVALAVVLALASVVALAALLHRLARMHEEMPEYGRRTGAIDWRLRGGQASDPTHRRTAAALASGPNAALLLPRRWWTRVRPGILVGSDVWDRSRHHRLATGVGRTPWVAAAALSAWITILPTFDERGQVQTAALLAVLLSTLTIPLAAHGWARRWPLLGYESLRPATRRQYLAEIGLAMARDTGSAWLAVTIGGMVPMVVWTGFAAGDWAAMVVLSFAATALLFAANVWVLRLRRGWVSVLGLALSVPAALVIEGVGLALSDAEQSWRGAGAPTHDWLRATSIAALLVMIAAATTYAAYRQWTKTDLD